MSPEITRSYCDQCNEEIVGTKYLIYSISFWSNKNYDEETHNFLRTNGIAKMFCSDDCIGKYLKDLIEGGAEELQP